MRSVDMVSMTRPSSIFDRSGSASRHAMPIVFPGKQDKLVLSAARSATQTAAAIAVFVVTVSTLSSGAHLGHTLARTEDHSSRSGPHARELDNVTLDDFVEKHLAQRDDLALRALRGELTAPEAAYLEILNATLNRLLPQPPALPTEVTNAIAEVHRLLGA